MLSCCFMAALALALGLFTRSASFATCLFFNYAYHIEQSNSGQLAGLLAQLSLLGCCLRWGR